MYSLNGKYNNNNYNDNENDNNSDNNNNNNNIVEIKQKFNVTSKKKQHSNDERTYLGVTGLGQPPEERVARF